MRKLCGDKLCVRCVCVCMSVLEPKRQVVCCAVDKLCGQIV